MPAKKTVSPLRPRYHTVRRYAILPTCLLVFNLIEEFIFYKCELVQNSYLRTLVMMVLFLLGISFVAFVVAPAIEHILSTAYRSTKKRTGHFGGWLFLIALLLTIFWAYHTWYSIGPEAILPASVVN